MTIRSRYAVTCEVAEELIQLIFDYGTRQRFNQIVINGMSPDYGVKSVYVSPIIGPNGRDSKFKALSVFTEPLFEGYKYGKKLSATVKIALKEIKNKN